MTMLRSLLALLALAFLLVGTFYLLVGVARTTLPLLAWMYAHFGPWWTGLSLIVLGLICAALGLKDICAEEE